MKITQVDAFTDMAFTGNPAAVCILDDLPSDAWLQDVAREMNVSETAFLLPHEEGYDLRWFTPSTEVDLCGHATLASAHVLWESGHLPAAEVARFHTRSGELIARRKGSWIVMDFPREDVEPIEPPAGLAEALGIETPSVHRNRFDLLVEVSDEKIVRTLHPDMGKLREIPVRGVIVTSPSVAASHDFVSRFFAPRVGVDEDPVTGSAHCALGPFWSGRFQRPELVGYQVSARGGIVRTKLAGDRVLLAGQAVTVLRGEMV